MRSDRIRRLLCIMPAVSGLVVVFLVGAVFLLDYGAHGWTTLLGATIGALITVLVSKVFIRRVMTGLASILGGVVGGIAIGGMADAIIGIDGESVVVSHTHSGVPVAPYLVLVGAVIGGAVWVVTVSIGLYNGAWCLRTTEQGRQCLNDRSDGKSDYLLVALGSFVTGPVLALVYVLIAIASGGVDSVDRWPVLGYDIQGPMGLLACVMVFGAVGGLLVGVPYIMAWMIKFETKTPGE